MDVARGIALLGMMSVHILAVEGPLGSVRVLAGGRSAALFAVLAGVGLSLASGGERRPTGAALSQARRAVLGRAAVVAGVGLTVGTFPTPAAIILVYYAVLFVVAIPVLGWPARRLAVAAGLAGLLTPVVSHLLRSEYEIPRQTISWLSLYDPLGAGWNVLIGGYYPVLTWTTYLFAGLAVGRLPLRRPAVAARLAVAGAALAAAAWFAGWGTVRLAGGAEALAAQLPAFSSLRSRDVGVLLADTFYGTTPTTSWEFLGIAAPHSGTPPDLLHTTGTALLVLGIALLVTPVAGRWVFPLAAAGSMTLTLYTLHVIALGFGRTADPDRSASAPWVLLAHIVVALALAVAIRSTGSRGPLEQLAADAAALAAGQRTPSGPLPSDRRDG